MCLTLSTILKPPCITTAQIRGARSRQGPRRRHATNHRPEKAEFQSAFEKHRINFPGTLCGHPGQPPSPQPCGLRLCERLVVHFRSRLTASGFWPRWRTCLLHFQQVLMSGSRTIGPSLFQVAAVLISSGAPDPTCGIHDTGLPVLCPG